MSQRRTGLLEAAAPQAGGRRQASRQALILPSNRGRSTGLVSKSAQPISMLLARSLDSACAVSAMTGIEAVAGAALISSVASQPSIGPSAMSINIRSGDSVDANATPAGPSTVEQTSNP